MEPVSGDEQQYWQALWEATGDQRPPTAQGQWFSITQERFDEFARSSRRIYNNVRLIHEGGFGDEDLDPCDKCRRLNRECWRFRIEAQQALGLGSKCTSCIIAGCKCTKKSDVTVKQVQTTTRPKSRLDDGDMSATYYGKRRDLRAMTRSQRASRSADINVDTDYMEPSLDLAGHPKDRLIRNSFNSNATSAAQRSRPTSADSDNDTDQRPRYSIFETYINELEDRNAHLEARLEIQHAQHVGIVAAFEEREQEYARLIEELESRIDELTLADRIKKAEAELKSMKRKHEELKAKDEGPVAPQRLARAKKARRVMESRLVRDSADEDEETDVDFLSSEATVLVSHRKWA